MIIGQYGDGARNDFESMHRKGAKVHCTWNLRMSQGAQRLSLVGIPLPQKRQMGNLGGHTGVSLPYRLCSHWHTHALLYTTNINAIH